MLLSEASFKDPKVADRRKPADTTEVESVSGTGWVGWGVSAATGGPPCAVSMGGGCGRDGDGLVDIAKGRRDHRPGGLHTTLGRRARWCLSGTDFQGG